MQDPSKSPRTAALQRWMQAVVTHSDGVAQGARSEGARQALEGAAPGGATIEQLICELPQLSAVESLKIYADMYAERLREALSLDYPALCDLLGAETFAELMSEYVATHPSQAKTLNLYGRELSSWLAVRPLASAAFAAELARLERAIVDVRTLPDANTLTLDALFDVPQSDWPALHLRLIPALCLLEMSYPVEGSYRVWRRSQELQVPEPERSFVVVFRQDQSVWRIELELEPFLVLKGLQRGLALGDAIEEAATSEGADPEILGQGLSGWFEEWAREGFFRALESSTA